MSDLTQHTEKAREASKKATWTRQDDMPEEAEGATKGRAIHGRSSDWFFVLITYELEGQVRYDGTFSKSGLVVRCTPELAEEFFKRADAAAK